MTPTLLLAWLLLALPAVPETPLPAVQAAIVDALRARLGAEAEFVVADVRLAGPVTGELTGAELTPGATFGRPMAFLLHGAVVRDGARVTLPIGRATATVDAVVSHWHTTHAVTRGTRLAEADLARVRHVLPRGAVKAPPAFDELVEGRALADLADDACLTNRTVAPSPAVVAGREVSAVVHVGGIEVRAALVAVDSGKVGTAVRVMHPGSRRTFRARVVGRAQVEIDHEP